MSIPTPSDSVSSVSWLVPDWPLPPGVRCLITTRHGGASAAPYDSFNLATHVGDAASAVAANRARLAHQLPGEPVWLEQVHGVQVADADAYVPGAPPPCADAAVAQRAGVVCTVLTADCLPVLFCSADGRSVGAAHAGWRGLCAGVLEACVARLEVPAAGVLAYLGPAIGPSAFEVGDEVRAAFLAHDAEAAACFLPGTTGKWFADLYALARLRLARLGVMNVRGGGLCTYTERERFYSYRRDGAQSGRMASLIWRELPAAMGHKDA